MKLFFFLLFLTNLSFASIVDRAKKGDDLQKIVKRNMDRFWYKYSGDEKAYSEDLKKWNPEIKDWRKLNAGELIYVDYPYDTFISNPTYIPSLVTKKINWPSSLKEKISLMLFYGVSFGSYLEKTNEKEISSTQNYPVTLGIDFKGDLEEKKHFLLGSFSWSQASKGMSSGNNDHVSEFAIPSELSASLYYEYAFKNVNLFSGYDFEKLNTFNTAEISLGVPIENAPEQLHFFSFGGEKTFFPLGLEMNLKASYSKVLSASSLKGEKISLSYSYKWGETLSVGTFFKHYRLSGKSDLTINRFGLSVGVFVF